MWFWLLVALAGGFALHRALAGYPDPGRPYRRLTRGEVAFLNGAADAMLPRGGAIEPSGSDADLAGYLDRLLDASATRIRVLMHLLFFLVEHATLFFPAPGGGGMRRFSALRPEQQEAALVGWRDSRLFPRRLVFTSLRALFTLGYFAHPTVLRHLRLAPYAIEPVVCEADLLYPPIGRGPDAIRFTRDDLTPPSDGTPIPLDAPLDPRYAEDAS